MTGKRYVRVSFPTRDDDEIVQAIASVFAPLGFEESDERWCCYFPVDRWSIDTGAAFLDRMAIAMPDATPEVEEFAEENWNRNWERSIEPIRISDAFTIVPSWNVPRAVDTRYVLVIDPKMSFGTGYHESTRTMLRLLERSVHGGERVLDVGTGTGILAIAAVLLGASQATGIDTDEWSERNARENIERNGVSDRITIERLDGNRVSGRFDLVLSNLTRLDNLALSDRLVSLVGRGGVVVAGGFYGREEPEIVERFTRLGCTADGFEREAEWSSVRFRID